MTRTMADFHDLTSGVVELPHRMFWQADRRFDLDDPFMLRWMYEIVLREALPYDELRTWLDAPTLHRLWAQLYLPHGVRRGWEKQHPSLRRARLARPGAVPAHVRRVAGEAGRGVTAIRDTFQVRVAQVALAVAERHGLALGGGHALIAHGRVLAMLRLDRLPDAAFAPYGLGPTEVAELRERFTGWDR